ncbi:MAG: LTA synthase family protein [Bacteroidales bacterium]|jgi:uncharacterized sulfatase|nr:LTA synthase family protein [Bacteroidales bacterium]
MKDFYRRYLKWVFLSLILVCGFRLIEYWTTGLKINWGYTPLSLELLGFIHDILLTSSILLLIFPLYYGIGRCSARTADIVMTILVILFSEIHFMLLGYFIYQLQPLDIFVFRHSLQEVITTVISAQIPFGKYGIAGLLIVFGIVFYLLWIKNKQWSYRVTKVTLTVQFCLLPLLATWQMIGTPDDSSFFPNKSFFFYRRCANELYHITTNRDSYTMEDALAYQQLHPDKRFLNTEYPFSHYLDAGDSLGNYLHSFDHAPNFVFLIVEGLNDDFIHRYREISLMPFLDSLAQQSLYWDRCFTLGERSYAVIPSLLGGLPYGKIGFTLMETFPRHHSLVSILKTNHYYTTFFYGQGAWFHSKDRFFHHNDIDLIVDKDKFGNLYQKIIVGDDLYFWGYNDRDLFSQAMNTIDTLPHVPRLDIYFTGSMHSPFVISDEDKYNERLNQLIHDIPDDDKRFFEQNQKYFKSILFADDEIHRLINEYACRPEFENTVFIITGDHPMTEIPIANSLKRYHVPLIIYSAALKEARTFHQPVSHLDVYETLLPFLKNYHIRTPFVSSSIGDHLFPASDAPLKKIPFMNGNRFIVDYYAGNHFLSENELYAVFPNLELVKSNDVETKKRLRKELEIFNNNNNYVCEHDKLLSDTLYCQNLTQLLFSKCFDNISVANKEFFDLIPSFKLSNRPFMFDISCSCHGNAKDVLLVYVLSTQKDSTVMWQCFGLENSQNQTHRHLPIPQQNISDTVLYFKCYVWNQTKNKMGLDRTKILLHTY